MTAKKYESSFYNCNFAAIPSCNLNVCSPCRSHVGTASSCRHQAYRHELPRSRQSRDVCRYCESRCCIEVWHQLWNGLSSCLIRHHDGHHADNCQPWQCHVPALEESKEKLITCLRKACFLMIPFEQRNKHSSPLLRTDGENVVCCFHIIAQRV